MNGLTVTDKITGFRGVVVGVVEYLSGCNQALVVSKATDGGKLPESMWFDVQRLEIDASIPAIVLDNGVAPGCDREPPKR